MDELTRVVPDRMKAGSIMKMVDSTLKMIAGLDEARFPSNVTREYYEAIRELASIVILLDGYKATGEGAHRRLFQYIGENYQEFKGSEISLMNELRVIRNRISYDGFFVRDDYIPRNKEEILGVIEKLRKIIEKKLSE